jgi:hypothetical protein
MKWAQRKTNPPREWIAAYSNADYKVITKENYLEFIV